MNDYEQFKKLLEKTKATFKGFSDDKAWIYNYLCFQDTLESEIIMVAKFNKSDNSIVEIYLADAINNIDDFDALDY